MNDRDHYHRRYEGRSHLPEPEPEASVFIHTQENYVYFYISSQVVHHRIALPGVAAVFVDLDEDENVIGVKLEGLTHMPEVVETLSSLNSLLLGS